MAYINTEIMEYPLSELDIRKRFPDYLFPLPFLPPEGYEWVFPTKAPQYNPVISALVERTPAPYQGVFYRDWEVVPKFTEYDNNGTLITVAEQESAAIAAHEALLAEEEAQRLRDLAKIVRQKNVDNITVTTTAGNTFDGDETSQNRMSRAIIALQATSTPSTLWVLADNSVVNVSAAELSEALALAGAAQASMWVIP